MIVGSLCSYNEKIEFKKNIEGTKTSKMMGILVTKTKKNVIEGLRGEKDFVFSQRFAPEFHHVGR